MARSLNKRFFGPANDKPQLEASVKFDGGAARAAYIIKQVSARRYLFGDAADQNPATTTTIKAKLVNGVPAAIGEAQVTFTPFGGAATNAMKITAKKVVGFDGTPYTWSVYAPDATGEASLIGAAEQADLTATAYAVLEVAGTILTLTISDAGTLYAGAESLTLTGGATLTVDTVDVGGEILTYTLTAGGSGYEVGDVLAVTAGSVAGVNAEFTVASISAAVDSYVVTSGGSGYTGAPVVTVSGNATAIAVVSNGIVTQVNVNAAGSGYTSAPTVSIAAPQ